MNRKRRPFIKNLYWLKKQSMKRILLLAFIFSAHSIYAQKLVTLQEVIQDALLKNYDILLVRTDSVAAAIDYEYKNVFFIPRLNGSA